ncbi:type VI secretion system Vgr family protein [Escherichia coli KTE233]|nr:type VI secretion system Vgr family protein [Escherichia coli KTE233]STN58303.1 bacteriophage N4 receptor, outer membrane subunit [Escherichia coli]
MSTGLRFTLEVDGLPPDAFAVVSFHLNQSLSSLFSLDLSLVSQQFLSLEFAQVLDKMAYLTIWQGDEVQRRVKGVVTWFELGENDKNQMLYSMKVHPPLWRAGLRQNFRIFQNEDIKSILGTMLQENGVTEWSPLFSEPHPSREFCVQYGETDYDFLCRMAAEEGIFFYEEHAYKSTDQSLVLCDTVRHLPESFEIPWNPNTRTEVSTLCISQFRYSAQIRPSSVVTKDYTFKRPGWAGRFEQEGQHQDYPFQGDARVSQTLMARLASLLESHPYLATPAKVAILSKPLPLAEQRQWQSQLPGIADNCPAIVRLLGDMSPSYDAAAWNRLAKCYRDTLPGVALYAWLQAEQRQPNAWQHRAVAYQAYQVEDYATALAAWQKISLHDMSNEDLLAAANTAQAAGNGAARDRWLQQAEQRGLGNNALYWWLHAQRYIPGQPELALSDLTRSINIAPSANAYVARATIYRQRHNVPAAVSDLRAALELEPNNSNIQAALGYALWDSGDIAQSREMLEQAHKGLPDDPALIRQLAYVNQRLDDMPATQHYARLVIDDIDNQALITPLTPEQNQQRFNFRRLHEEVGRRWTFSFDSSIGLRSGAMSTANNNVGGAAPGKSYRSYGQLEAEYRIGRNMLLEGDLLSVYSRVFADTGENGVMMPVKNPMSGTGLRWKPLRDQIFFLAVEQQLPLNGQNGASDTMLRASASFFNGGKYSDEWHPNGSGWFAQTCTSMRRNISARIFRRGRQIIASAGIRR